MKPRIKFRCKVADLIDAARSDAHLENVVIEIGYDIEGVVDALLGVIESHFISRKDMDCRVEGENATIELCARADNYLIRNGLYTAYEAEMVIRCGFLEEVKQLQNLILPQSDSQKLSAAVG